MTSLTSLPPHPGWLDQHAEHLVDFARASRHPDGGFAWLDERGRPDPCRPVHTWVTARMTHVFSLAHLRGTPDVGPLADHGVRALAGRLRDQVHDGWFGGVAADGPTGAGAKSAYEHAFVVLAASSAAVAGRPGAAELLRDALAVVERRFWSDADGRCLEAWDRSWTEPEPYRGANSSMHMVEAFLAAGDLTGDPRWHERALRICGHLVHEVAARHGWRVVEHFAADWTPVLDYNQADPGHPFRPYGSTVGHWFEWSRLLLHVEAAVPGAPGWLLADARALFDAAVARGWQVDGAPGFVYTLDWADRPVVRARMHWVVAEATLAAAALHRRTGEDRYDEWYRRWWAYAADVFVDGAGGSWHHELDPRNRPARSVWGGKPDVYHAFQAVLLPQLPLTPSAAVALRGA